MDSRLSRLQSDLLREFFHREARFLLTGGAALAGFVLGHRETQDLDLFTAMPILDAGDLALRGAAIALGARVEEISTSPAFRRRLVSRDEESVVVDLVHDESAKSATAQFESDGVRVETPSSILAAKLCTLLSRAEIRDLVDVRALEAAGFRIEDSLGEAMTRDAGLTPAQLAWVLSQISIGDDARIPGGGSAGELRVYLETLIRRLTALAMPG